jgi:hypothetical protein
MREREKRENVKSANPGSECNPALDGPVREEHPGLGLHFVEPAVAAVAVHAREEEQTQPRRPRAHRRLGGLFCTRLKKEKDIDV